jgi:uncharacterized protein (DUF952 family)
MLCHITTGLAWAEAVAAKIYRPPSLASEGFIHFSTEAQVAETQRRWFAGISGLVVLYCNVDGDVQWDDTPHGRFPHLYRALELHEVQSYGQLPRLAETP